MEKKSRHFLNFFIGKFDTSAIYKLMLFEVYLFKIHVTWFGNCGSWSPYRGFAFGWFFLPSCRDFLGPKQGFLTILVGTIGSSVPFLLLKSSLYSFISYEEVNIMFMKSEGFWLYSSLVSHHKTNRIELWYRSTGKNGKVTRNIIREWAKQEP